MRILDRIVYPAAFLVLGLQACGGSSGGGQSTPTQRCLHASDCSGALICVQGFCVQACVESKDCPAGQRCIEATEGNVCQPPERATCIYTSECTQPLVCAADLQCRSQCQSNVDCPKSQVCTSVTKLCADPTIDTNYNQATNDFNVSADGGVGTVDGGGTKDAPAGAADSSLPGAEAGQPDAPAMGSMDGGVVDQTAAPFDAAGPDISANFDGPALPVDGVVVSPSSSVRQGQINVTITITRAAGGLSSAELFDLGDLTVRPQSGGTDTSLVLKVSVPHGAPLGARTLQVATSSGVITAANVVNVTAITSGPLGADTNAGSAGSPFLTLKQAMLVADVDDTIHLMDGTYNTKGGETWGYVIPDNLTIVGDSTAGTVIDGVGATNNPNGLNASTAVTLKTLTLQHFYYGVDMKEPASTLTMQDVVLAGNSNTAIYVEQAATGSTVNVLGKAGLIDQPSQNAITVYNAPSVAVNITDATVRAGNYAIYFVYNCSAGKLNVSGATIEQLANSNAIYMGISSNAVGTTAVLDNATVIGNITDTDPKGTLTITGSNITQKNGNGMDFSALSLVMANSTLTMSSSSTGIYFSGIQSTMSLTSVTVTGGGYGIQQTGAGSSAKLRGTTIQGTAYHAYYLTAGDLDLGTATESGDDVISAPTNTSYWCLYISRPQGASAGNPVTCSGTTLNGLAPSPGTIDASAGTISLAPQRYYVSTGNQLIFY